MHDHERRPRPRLPLRLLRRRVLLAGAGAAVLVVLVWFETSRSWVQAYTLHRVAEASSWTMVDEPPFPPATLEAPSGPYDIRLGYTDLPEFRTRLETRGFTVEALAAPSPGLARIASWGLFPPYREKGAAGLEILGDDGEPVFRARYPDNLFASFADIPPVVRDALLWIENRELLSPAAPTTNPAIEWRRLSGAVIGHALRSLGAAPSSASGGGSTLATQIEKFRHSRNGVTATSGDKLRQIASASVRAYVDGPGTLQARRRIVRDYINAVPLAAIEGYGEVNGLGNGLWAWYGLEFEEVVPALRVADEDASPAELTAKAEAFRAVLSLFVAQRRPTYYLTRPDGRADLDDLVDAHVRLLMRDGVVSEALGTAALGMHDSLVLRAHAPERPPIDFVHRKAASALRSELLGLLDVGRLYELDRLDLEVESTISVATQQAVSEELERLRDADYVRSIGLTEARLLEAADPSRVHYSLLLLERTPRGNLLRVQADNFPGPFDINRSSKLELGSTAKLRTLVTYLEVIAAVHAELTGVDPVERDSLAAAYGDPLTRWTHAHLIATPEATLSETLSAAMERTYSANPAEAFFTGGGLHRFSNFDNTYDLRQVTVSESFRQSVNLVFVRMMRDIVRYHTLRVPGSSARILEDPADPARLEYLRRFADREGQIFISRFHRKYADVAPERLLATFLEGRTDAVQRLAWTFRAVRPDGGAEELAALLTLLDPESTVTAPALEDALRRANAAEQNLPDLGYLSGVHPLEIEVVRHLLERPDASLSEVVGASADARQEVYRWLFRSTLTAQNQRIRTMLEVEAFLEIGVAWQRLGYPFANLVPSLGTSIGSSGDRPFALAELIGILVNDGVRRPVVTLERFRFAGDTPYETVLGAGPSVGEPVLAPEVARTVLAALRDVVENGTGRRAWASIPVADGAPPLGIGGKTGTGDNRRYTFAPSGAATGFTVVNRTAAFTFHIEDRYFGVLTAFVLGPEAGDYRFTSALPVQVFRQLAPSLAPLVTRTVDEEPPAGWMQRIVTPRGPLRAPPGLTEPAPWSAPAVLPTRPPLIGGF